MTSSDRASSKPPEPAPSAGKATEWKSCWATSRIALCVERVMESADARHSRLMAATWMMARWGNRPAPVRTAPPSGMGPWRATSRKGCVPPRRFIAPDTPCGHSSHQGMTLGFHALTSTSTSWSRRSPSTSATRGATRQSLLAVGLLTRATGRV